MINLNEPGRRVILSGNEALARGALEAGVDFCASYPGSPAVEAADALFKIADKHNIYGEWSTNEMVAVEAAAAASFAGLRSYCVVKHNGLAVVADFLTTLNHAGTKGGMVIVVGDDPGGHSSINEVDSRAYARLAEVPLLEPSTVEEARDMTRWAFELSEQIKTFVIIRVVTRICHARGNVVLGELPDNPERTAQIGPWDRFLCLAFLHGEIHSRLEEARALYEESAFNSYIGPQDATAIVVASGPSALYAREALERLWLDQKVGLYKMGATWPLPRQEVLKQLGKAEQIIFVEEFDPFLETSITSMLAQFGEKTFRFYGQASGHINGELGTGIGELNTDLVIKGLSKVFDMPEPANMPDTGHLDDILEVTMPNREMAMCPGCPHRASFWALKTALEVDGREGFVLGDIGCYTLGLARSGYYLLRSVFCMGSGVGLANGFGQLHRFGMHQPVLAVMGDSTFFHACLPALINGYYNSPNFVAVVLDNSTTAMTGFQPNPGIGFSATGTRVNPLVIEDITANLGLRTVVADPHQLNDTIEVLCDLLQEKGPRVLVLRKECALTAAKKEKRLFKVDPEKCISEECGCNNFCGRTFGCPAISISDNKALINDVICTGCGACAALCPREAIVEVNMTEVKDSAKV